MNTGTALPNAPAKDTDQLITAVGPPPIHSETSQRDRFRTLTFPCRRNPTGHLHNHGVTTTIGKPEWLVLAIDILRRRTHAFRPGK